MGSWGGKRASLGQIDYVKSQGDIEGVEGGGKDQGEGGIEEDHERGEGRRREEK